MSAETSGPTREPVADPHHRVPSADSQDHSPIVDVDARTVQPPAVRSILQLQRAVGNRATVGVLQRQGAGAARPAAVGRPPQPAPQLVPRQDYVFIMGQDRPRTPNPFYRSALRYFRAQVPGATFVVDQRSMDGVLAWIAGNVQQPIGNIYIVTHANEDGTLSFGLDPADADHHLTVGELRSALHPAGGGAGPLPRLAGQVDAQTRIHIKGCDLGRTQEMVELIDQAFGGAGTVIAPTHEQVYGYDPTIGGQARERERARVEAAHPMPAPVDPQLRGQARVRARRVRQQALRLRTRESRAELDRIAEQAGVFEALSGPMFQRPGAQLYDPAELASEVDRLYAHLDLDRRQDIVRQLVAPDRRSERVARRDGTLKQHGQRVYRHVVRHGPFDDPQNEQEALALLRRQLPRRLRHPTVQLTRQRGVNGTGVRITIEGEVPGRGGTTQVFTFEATTDPVPEAASLLQELRDQLPNPDRYRLRVDRRHANGRTSFVVTAERVIAYMHHGSLDPARHEHFRRPINDRNFYTSSTFAPPRPRTRPGGRGP